MTFWAHSICKDQFPSNLDTQILTFVLVSLLLVSFIPAVPSFTRPGRSRLQNPSVFCSVIGPRLDPLQVGVVTMGNVAYRWVELLWYSRADDLARAVSTVPWTPGERANITGALWFIRERMFTASNGDRPGASNVSA